MKQIDCLGDDDYEFEEYEAKYGGETPRWLCPVYHWLGLKTRQEKRREHILENQRKLELIYHRELSELERAVEVVQRGQPPKFYGCLTIMSWPGRFPKGVEERIRNEMKRLNAKARAYGIAGPVVRLVECAQAPLGMDWRDDDEISGAAAPYKVNFVDFLTWPGDENIPLENGESAPYQVK